MDFFHRFFYADELKLMAMEVLFHESECSLPAQRFDYRYIRPF